jgi:hypothetical protein
MSFNNMTEATTKLNEVTNKNMNGRSNILNNKTKDLLADGADGVSHFGAKAFEEVENMTTNLLAQVRTQVNAFSARSLELIKKNPVIAVAAAVTVGLVVAKLMRKTPRIENDSAISKY